MLICKESRLSKLNPARPVLDAVDLPVGAGDAVATQTLEAEPMLLQALHASSHSSAVALSLPPRSRRLSRLSRTGWHDPACRRFGYRDAKAQFAPASGDGAAGRLVGFGVGVSPLLAAAGRRT